MIAVEYIGKKRHSEVGAYRLPTPRINLAAAKARTGSQLIYVAPS